MASAIDPVLAKPADLCCLKGDFHNGEPTGEIIQIDGVDTYVATPDPEIANGNVVLLFPDAFGLHINLKLMMDAYAACGYLVLGVDYFLGVSSNAICHHDDWTLVCCYMNKADEGE
jgi:dienelactone hydrolase